MVVVMTLLGATIDIKLFSSSSSFLKLAS